ncbi:ABC transporter substrate-binding protein [Atopobacter phocae]|uniref:ABC transporter substrate-binding protein n=1 Tax=Atopobacter phocae TaxID=136492 RepID=UPI0004723837|nr:extracellular solute-binding protein [Atopobacter phocae]
MKKKNLLLIISLFLAIVLVGCSTESKQEANSNEISFMIPDWGAPTDDMLKEFKDETGITVNVIPTSWDDIRSKIATAAAGNQVAADVFEVDWSWLGEFRSADWLMPIEMSEEDIKDMPTLKSFSVDNEIYAIPYANDFRIAYFNEDMFKQVGKEAPKSWDDLYEAAMLLKEKGIAKYPVGLPLRADESTTTTLMWLAYTRNNIFFNDDNTINEEALKDGLETIDQFVKAGLIDPSNTEISGQQVYAKILNSEIAFMVGPSSYVTRVNDDSQSKVVGQVKPILLPGKTDTAQSTLPFAEAVGISKYTKNKEAAETFVKWYTSKKNQIKSI